MLKSNILVYSPTPTMIGDSLSEKRLPTRPSDLVDDRYIEEFDNETFVYDAISNESTSSVTVICPPPNNLKKLLGDLSAIDPLTGKNFKVQTIDFDRQYQIRAHTRSPTADLGLVTDAGVINIPVSRSRPEIFSDCRVLQTMSSNNNLQWIQDWIRFNRDVNGADAVLIYDNSSVLYSIDDLSAALAEISGLKACVVVRWPFKFGPQGQGLRDYWDSDFCQLAALEHARWMFLQRARSVIVSDIDELILGDQSPFQAAEKSVTGFARYFGRWVVAPVGETDEASSWDDRRHRDFGAVLKRFNAVGRLGLPVDLNRCASKWTVVPSRCPPKAQWHIHTIKGWLARLTINTHLEFRHFRPISTSWKYDRKQLPTFNPEDHERDERLADAMSRVRWDA